MKRAIWTVLSAVALAGCGGPSASIENLCSDRPVCHGHYAESMDAERSMTCWFSCELAPVGIALEQDRGCWHVVATFVDGAPPEPEHPHIVDCDPLLASAPR